MTTEIPSQPLSFIKPSPARIYDYLLGGKDNLQADRAVGDEVISIVPAARSIARQNREFMQRAVRYCAANVRQFLDIGTGMPTSPNVSDVVRQVRGDAVNVGVDNDRVVVANNRASLVDVQALAGDIRDPRKIIDEINALDCIDWAQPVALLFIAVMHYVTDPDEPAAIVGEFRERLAPGSMVVISHACSTGADPVLVEQIEGICQRAAVPFLLRSCEGIVALFDGFELVEPGVVPVEDWRTESTNRSGTPTFILGGVGRVPLVRSA